VNKYLGLVTVLYNSEEFLEDFLNCIASQEYSNYKIYLIDNSSNFHSFNLINKFFEYNKNIKYEYIKNNENYGVAKANNQGINAALKDGCESIILLNNDIDFDDYKLFKKFSELSSCYDIIFPKILYFKTKRLWYSGGYISKFFGNGVHKNINKFDSEPLSGIKYTEYGPTCFVLINAAVFRVVGLMDEKYFVYYDDLDFMCRVKKFGIMPIYDSSLVIYHKVSSSTGGDRSLFSLFYNSRNSIYYIKKNYIGINRYFLLTAYTLARLTQSILLSSKQRSTIIKGLLDGYKM
jgi:GT2 family glycosyltransferase